MKNFEEFLLIVIVIVLLAFMFNTNRHQESINSSIIQLNQLLSTELEDTTELNEVKSFAANF